MRFRPCRPPQTTLPSAVFKINVVSDWCLARDYDVKCKLDSFFAHKYKGVRTNTLTLRCISICVCVYIYTHIHTSEWGGGEAEYFTNSGRENGTLARRGRALFIGLFVNAIRVGSNCIFTRHVVVPSLASLFVLSFILFNVYIYRRLWARRKTPVWFNLRRMFREFHFLLLLLAPQTCPPTAA